MHAVICYLDPHSHVRRITRLQLTCVDIVSCADEVDKLLQECEYSNWEWWQVRNSKGIAVLWNNRV